MKKIKSGIKIGDWVKHEKHGIGRVMVDQQGFTYFVFPEAVRQGRISVTEITKVIPKFDNFADLFEEVPNETSISIY